MDTYKEYDPEQSTQTKRIAAHVWDQMRPDIEELYLTEDYTVEDVAELMKAKHGFEARSAHASLASARVS